MLCEIFKPAKREMCKQYDIRQKDLFVNIRAEELQNNDSVKIANPTICPNDESLIVWVMKRRLRGN
jgi:hypothetical protein